MPEIHILGISGSPVKASSTDMLVLRVIEAAKASLKPAFEVKSDFVRLNELKFIPCQSCGVAPTPGWCFYDDDLQRVYSLVARCDCLIFGSPVHFDSVSAQSKVFIDRCNCFRPADFGRTQQAHDFIKLLKSKRPGAMILVGGKHAWFEGSRRCLAGFFKWIEVTNEGLVTYVSEDFTEPRLVSQSQETLKLADELGEKLGRLLSEEHQPKI